MPFAIALIITTHILGTGDVIIINNILFLYFSHENFQEENKIIKNKIHSVYIYIFYKRQCYLGMSNCKREFRSNL